MRTVEAGGGVVAMSGGEQEYAMLGLSLSLELCKRVTVSRLGGVMGDTLMTADEQKQSKMTVP